MSEVTLLIGHAGFWGPFPKDGFRGFFRLSGQLWVQSECWTWNGSETCGGIGNGASVVEIALSYSLCSVS